MQAISALLAGPWLFVQPVRETDLWPPVPLSPAAQQGPLNGTSTRETDIRKISFFIWRIHYRYGGEKAENNWLTRDFGIMRVFPLCVQTLANIVVSAGTVRAIAHQNDEQASLHFVRHQTEQNVNSRGLHQKIQRLWGEKRSSPDSK